MVLEDFCLRMGEILTALLIFQLKALWKKKKKSHSTLFLILGFLLQLHLQSEDCNVAAQLQKKRGTCGHGCHLFACSCYRFDLERQILNQESQKKT